MITLPNWEGGVAKFEIFLCHNQISFLTPTQNNYWIKRQGADKPFIVASIVKVILILFSDYKYVLEWIEQKRLGKFYNITIERRESVRK